MIVRIAVTALVVAGASVLMAACGGQADSQLDRESCHRRPVYESQDGYQPRDKVLSQCRFRLLGYLRQQSLRRSSIATGVWAPETVARSQAMALMQAFIVTLSGQFGRPGVLVLALRPRHVTAVPTLARLTQQLHGDPRIHLVGSPRAVDLDGLSALRLSVRVGTSTSVQGPGTPTTPSSIGA